MARLHLDTFTLEIPGVNILDIDLVGTPYVVEDEDGNKAAYQTIVQKLVVQTEVDGEKQEMVVENKNRTVPAELASLIIKFLLGTDNAQDRGAVTQFAKTFNDRINVIEDPSRTTETQP